MKKSPIASLWVIVVMGIMTVIALGSLGLWNQTNPIMKVRNQVFESFAIKVARTDMQKGPKGRVTDLHITLDNKEAVNSHTLRTIGNNSFYWILDAIPNSSVTRVTVISKEGQQEVINKNQLNFFNLAKNMRGQLTRVIMKSGLGIPKEVRVIQADNEGAEVEVSVQILDPKLLKKPRTAMQIERLVRKAAGGVLGIMVIKLFDSANKEQLKKRFAKDGSVIKEAAPKAEKGAKSPKKPG